MNQEIQLIECPRDAMQGLERFIETESKVAYINQLLRVGFHTIDFGSFVSPRAIPQMADTKHVLDRLDFTAGHTKLLAIVANTRGAEEASHYEAISYLGFPLSISETFQKRNTNTSIPEALNTLAAIKEICLRSGKQLVTYISMGFGNPYGDPYEVDLVGQFADVLMTLGSDIISLADTIGVADSVSIETLFKSVSTQLPHASIGVHLHATRATSREKIDAAWRGGCRRFDGALLGFGGCPMAADELVGNIDTEIIAAYMKEKGISTALNEEALAEAVALAKRILL